MLWFSPMLGIERLTAAELGTPTERPPLLSPAAPVPEAEALGAEPLVVDDALPTELDVGLGVAPPAFALEDDELLALDGAAEDDVALLVEDAIIGDDDASDASLPPCPQAASEMHAARAQAALAQVEFMRPS